jgi:hypothetical protein
MGNINASEILLKGIEIPAPRFNPYLIDIEKMTKDEANLIWKEY